MYRRVSNPNKGIYISITLLAVCGISYVSINLFDSFFKFSESRKRLDRAESEIAVLEQQYEVLQKEKQHMASVSGVEQQIRAKYDLTRPEENVVFIIEEKEIEVVVPEEKPNRFMDFFRGFFSL